MRWIGISKTLKDNQILNESLQGANKQVEWIESLADLKDSFSSEDSGVLLLSASHLQHEQDIYQKCRDLSLEYPSLSVLIFAVRRTIDIKKALRCGAFDVLTFPLNQEQLRTVFKDVEYDPQAPVKPKVNVQARKKARIMTICSTKGGVGKTTFTVNLASSFAKQLKKVLVIDLDLQFGDVAMFLDCKPKKTIYEYSKEGNSGNIKNYTYSYDTNIDIIAAPHRPEFSEVITDETVSRLLATVAPFYDIVLIDTAPYMEERILTAMEKSDDIFLITNLDLPTLRNSKTFVETLRSLNLIGKVKPILNRDSKRKGISSNVAANILGLPFYLNLPELEKVVAPSVNEGTPFVVSQPRAKISKSLFFLASELTGNKPQKEPGKKKSSLRKKELVESGRRG